MRAERSLASPRTSRIHHGARMIVTAIRTTATGRTTSRAGASESLSERNSSAPPITSAAPTPALLTASRGSWLRCARASGAVCDWRQISAPPAAAITTGQVILSLNHGTHSRTSRTAASVRQPIPAATSHVSRRLSSRATTGRSGPSAGISTQPMT